MAHTRYQVTLSTDGKHQVTATTDNQADVNSAVDWARTMYEQLVDRYGAEGNQPKRDGGDEGSKEPPICAVHTVPMVRVQGRRGPFWSCHERTPDGKFCSYRPSEE